MLAAGNLLNLAMSVVGKTPVMYYSFLSRVTNDGGIDVTNYNPGIVINNCNVQPINKSKYEAYGLDFEKSYISWFVSSIDAVDLSRDSSGDVIETMGKRWQLCGGNNWLGVAGWEVFTAVYIGPSTGNLTNV